MLLKKRAASRPRHAPAVDWTNSLTRGLVGLVWTGEGKSRELVGTSQWPIEGATTTKTGTPRGVGTKATATFAGIYSARQSVETASTSSSNWRHSAPPLSLMWFSEITTTPPATAAIAGVDGNNNNGYTLLGLFGTNTRGGAVSNGPTTRVLIDGSSTPTVAGDTTWYPGASVKGMTIDGTAHRLYDRGLLRASNAGSSASMTYDTTFGRTMMLSSPDAGTALGVSYWMGTWNRALSEAEVASLNADPWQLFAPLPRRIWAPTVISGPPLSALQAYNITPSTAKLRVTLTF